MVNKEHPDYKKYQSEAFDLRDKMINEIDKVEMPQIKGLDGETTAIYKKYAKKLKELQQKYKHLFVN